MTRLPKITIQKWTDEGPAYTIHRALAGFRNRKQRRARDGSGGSEELVGPHGLAERVDPEPEAFLLYVSGEDEVYAFAPGYVYQIDETVDGEPMTIHVDARLDVATIEFSGGAKLVGQRALDEDELAALLDELEGDANDYDEITAPGEKGPEGLALLEDADAPTEETPTAESLTSESIPEPEPEPEPEQLPTQPPAPATNHAPQPYVDAQDEALDRDGDYEANLDAVLEERAASPDNLSLEDLEALTAPDETPATSEDAVGGDGGKPVDDDAE